MLAVKPTPGTASPLRNVSIGGGGVLDGQGFMWWPFRYHVAEYISAEKYPPYFVTLSAIDRLAVTNVTFLDPPMITLQTCGTRNAVFAHLNITASCTGANLVGTRFWGRYPAICALLYVHASTRAVWCPLLHADCPLDADASLQSTGCAHYPSPPSFRAHPHRVLRPGRPVTGLRRVAEAGAGHRGRRRQERHLRRSTGLGRQVSRLRAWFPHVPLPRAPFEASSLFLADRPALHNADMCLQTPDGVPDDACTQAGRPAVRAGQH